MDILVGLDHNFVKQLAVLMISAYKNHDKLCSLGAEGITFWVLQSDFNSDDINFLNNIALSYNQKINFITVDEGDYYYFLLNEKWRQVTAERFPVASYFHLLAHKYLPLSLKKVLALDVDLIIDGDIQEFYSLDFNGCPIIVNHILADPRKEPDKEFDAFDYGKDFVRSDLIIKEGKTYFNSGVIIYNLDKLREMGVDREYYKTVVEKFEAGITDERIANYSYASMAKFVRTAKYNYRMSIAQKGYFRIENRIRNDEPVHTFYWIDAKIIHYGGALTNIKPWFLNFNEGEIKHANQEYFLLLPEISKLFPLWWKYAAYLPANTYNELLLNEKINKAAYNMIKSVTIWQREIFLNTLGVETLNIPSNWGENNIEPNFDLNDYVKPKLYRCIDGKTKVTGKNLPKDFYQISGFRLVVKSIAAYAGEKTSILQIIEPNDGCASVYRRCGTKQGKNWSKWYKVATTDDVCNVADEKVKELSCYLDKRFDNLVDDFESERESTQKAIDDLRKIVNKLQEEQAKLSSENHNLVVANKNLEAKNRRLENNLTTAQSDLVSIQNSVSYKFGRTMTYIPRKIRDAFKTKK